MNPRLLILATYLVTGLLLAGLSIPLILRKIKPNYFYGFRVPKTINNPEIWYAINAYAGQRLFAAGLILAVAALGLYVLAPNLGVDVFSSVLTGAALVTLGVGIGQSFYKLGKM